jgi:hypothetical protein
MPQLSLPERDPLDSLLSLEDQYHTEGYNLGLIDGARAGRIEGRTFGLEKGYEKFLELGRLGGRAAVWSARLSPSSVSVSSGRDVQIPQLEASERRRKNVRRLCDLTDASTLSTENSEDAVGEFESRLKDARAKATLISRAVGEDGQFDVSADVSGSLPRTTGTKGVRLKSEGVKTGRGGEGEMEDFSGVLPITKSNSHRETED